MQEFSKMVDFKTLFYCFLVQSLKVCARKFESEISQSNWSKLESAPKTNFKLKKGSHSVKGETEAKNPKNDLRSRQVRLNVVSTLMILLYNQN